jgi:hypothetical protein
MNVSSNTRPGLLVISGRSGTIEPSGSASRRSTLKFGMYWPVRASIARTSPSLRNTSRRSEPSELCQWLMPRVLIRPVVALFQSSRPVAGSSAAIRPSPACTYIVPSTTIGLNCGGAPSPAGYSHAT